MSRTLVPGSSPVPVLDLSSLDDALACASAALVHAWRGDQESASRSLLEARAATEEAFGLGSPGVDALSVVFTAISNVASTQNSNQPAVAFARHGRPRTNPASDRRGP